MRQQFPPSSHHGFSRQTCALALAGALALAACSRKEAAAPAPRPVVALAVHADGHALQAASLPGEVQARYSTPLSFRIAGKIIERRVRLGDTVKSGEVVALLDPADAQKNAAATQAQLDAAQHTLVYAQQQLDRDKAQAKENLIAPAQLEQTTNAYASALAQRDQAQQQAALANNQLQYTTLVAGHAGVITAEQADTGQNVSAGQAVYNLAWSGDVDVLCDVPESALAAFAVGQNASVTLAALPGRRFSARVRELSPAADPQSRTWRARLTLIDAGADVRLGMTADVTPDVPLAQAAAQRGMFTLPVTALFHEGREPAVWVVRAADNTLELRRVTVTRYYERTFIVSEGLKDGDSVVLQGVHTVSAGQKVRVIAPLHPEDFAS
ncbi:efflux RND transporter periplasmic adaptor subunit [Paraburkholderia sp. MMS20-SJTN17]|uniref:Efflux RND transporter periplasmic adaptor subunit n=1 Tax=Paraburkholderia translucens TaxID=2886945 RepID=A0ABS8KL74_9BURK|nr:efflux RND transporter periplasmic adaptor subunit [Paraburkholderia sp. MMS20-SJTN17]MCC8405470.1 efflux RND transporter periplasmic adaptor subunit [Paraburkholderia sp. MMS20-SJTN17]